MEYQKSFTQRGTFPSLTLDKSINQSQTLGDYVGTRKLVIEGKNYIFYQIKNTL